MQKYIYKIKMEVKEGKRGSSYPTLKRMSGKPGDTSQTGFQLPSHVALNLSSAQSAEVIADHFSSISQEYPRLETQNLPPNVRTFLQNNDQTLAPKLSVSEVVLRIMKAKKPNGLVPGDLPKKLVKTCAATLAVPLTAIFNSISKTMENGASNSSTKVCFTRKRGRFAQHCENPVQFEGVRSLCRRLAHAHHQTFS